MGIWEEVTQTEGTAWARAPKLIQENKEARPVWPGGEGTVGWAPALEGLASHCKGFGLYAKK